MCSSGGCFPKQNQSKLSSEPPTKTEGMLLRMTLQSCVGIASSILIASYFCRCPVVFTALKMDFLSLEPRSPQVQQSFHCCICYDGCPKAGCFYYWVLLQIWPKCHLPHEISVVWSRTHFFGLADICSGDYTISCSHVVQYNHNHKGSHFLVNMQLIWLLLFQQCDICSEKCQDSLFQMLLDT